MSNITKTKVFIDPGHGDPWPGAVSASGLMERVVVLSIANAASNRLRALGAQTQLSRTDSNALVRTNLDSDLTARVTKSNNYVPTIFVSIHNNAAESTAANGVETLVASGASSLTKNLASRVNSLVASRTGMNQRSTPVVERSNIRVLYSDNRAVWRILVEVGFLSNASDASKLNTSTTRTAAGNAIADAIRDFVNAQPPM